MQTWSDAKLLCAYADDGAEDAFAELVSRHTNLVFSAALRQVNSPDIAAEIAQRVFVALALDARLLAPRLAPDASLAGWLCRSARNVALNLRRDDFRRRAREELAMNDPTTPAEPAPDWEQVRPVLDEAMSELNADDYEAIVLRYFQNRDYRAVGLALGVSDDTAQKRVSRALEKLRAQLDRRGVTTASALSIALSAKAVEAAPAGLAASISAATCAVHGAVAASSTLTTTKAIVMTTLQKAFVAAAVAAMLGTSIYGVHRSANLQSQASTLETERDSLAQQLQQQRENLTRQLAVAKPQSNSSSGDVIEIAKLRAQVTRLQNQLAQSAADRQNPVSAQAVAWIDRVQKLKDKVAQLPNVRIPEFQYLTEQDWLDAVRNIQRLDSEDDYQQAIKNLQNAARSDFRNAISSAIRAYDTANPNSQPSDFAQLQPYFAQAPNSSVLQDYSFTQPGTVLAKSTSLIDATGNYTSYNMKIEANGVGGTSYSDDSLHGAIQSYLAANNNQPLTDPTQLLPYVSTPDEKTALQKILQSNQPQ